MICQSSWRTTSNLSAVVVVVSPLKAIRNVEPVCGLILTLKCSLFPAVAMLAWCSFRLVFHISSRWLIRYFNPFQGKTKFVMAAVVRNAHVLHCERGKCYNDRSMDRSIGVVGNSVARLIYIPLVCGVRLRLPPKLSFCSAYYGIWYKWGWWGGVG